MDNFKARADEARQRLARAIVLAQRAAHDQRGLELAAARLERAKADADAIIVEAPRHKSKDADRAPWYTDGQYA
jgi:hypothetical protein